MNIVSTQYSLNYESFEIYLSGCDGICGKSCHNPELWNYNLGNDYKDELSKIKHKIQEFDSMIKWIWILGGEPLLQNKEDLKHLIIELREFNKPIMLFTRFDLNHISNDIVQLFDYIKTGKYIEKLKTDNNIQYGIKLSTSNQQIHKINKTNKI